MIILCVSFQHSQALMNVSSQSSARQKEKRAAVMVIAMIAAFLVSWLPYAIICFVKMAGLNVTPTVSALPLLCAKSSICWNPIIYVVLNEQVIDIN